MKKLFLIIMIFVYVAFTPLHLVMAKEEIMTKDEVMNFLEQAFLAQVSLSEKNRTLVEIDEILDPYFSEDYKQVFLDENLVRVDGGYRTFGTDFAPYFIPFMSFSDRTKVVHHEKGKQIYVYEFFPGNTEGPITYDDHHEGILLEMDKDQWEITKWIYNQIPEEILKQEATTTMSHTKTNLIRLSLQMSNVYQLSFQPITTFSIFAMSSVKEAKFGYVYDSLALK